MSEPRPLTSSRPGFPVGQVRRPATVSTARPRRAVPPPGVTTRGSTPPRPDPRQFVGRLKRVVVAGSVVAAGVFWALVAEHVVGITSVQGSGAAGVGGGAVPQAASPYDGFFGPAGGQAAAGALNQGGLLGGSGTGGVQAAGPGLVNGGGGAPIMTTSGS